MKKVKYLIIGVITGALLATTGQTFAAAINKITASVRNDFTVSIDGKKVELKNAPLAYNGNSYLPVRELSELLGRDVDFKDGEIQLRTKGSDLVLDVKRMDPRYVLEVVANKYPELLNPLPGKINMDSYGVLTLGDKKFNLPVIDTRFVDASILIEEGIFTEDDLKNYRPH